MTDVMVIEGEIEVNLPSAPLDAQPIRLLENDAMRADRTIGTLESIDVDNLPTFRRTLPSEVSLRPKPQVTIGMQQQTGMIIFPLPQTRTTTLVVASAKRLTLPAKVTPPSKDAPFISIVAAFCVYNPSMKHQSSSRTSI